jgi:glucose dehydrogenase
VSICAIAVFATGALAQSFVPVTDAVLANPDQTDWLMINRTYDEQRFSPLKEINTGNVAQLRMA